MAKTEHKPCRWEHCPPGAIGEVAQRKHSMDRRQVLKMAGLASVTLIGGAGAIAYIWNPEKQKPEPAFLSCTMVAENLPDFVAGRLAPRFDCEMRQHLAHCPPCAEFFRKNFPLCTY